MAGCTSCGRKRSAVKKAAKPSTKTTIKLKSSGNTKKR